MIIAHVVACTPHKCGLYETARELAAGEIAQGATAYLFDPREAGKQVFHPGESDRGVPVHSAIGTPDVVCDHSGTDFCTKGMDTPHVYVCHGRPRSSFIGERDGGLPVYSYRYRIDDDPRYKAVVTFWSEHVGHLEAVFAKTPVYSISPCVDVGYWSQGGVYDFGGKAGAYNVVVSDMWRDDVDPFDVLHGLILAARRMPGLKVHVYGCQVKTDRGWPVLINRLSQVGAMGEFKGLVPQGTLRSIYHSCDMVVTPHTIATRTVREAMASGCQVIAGATDPQDTCERVVRRLRGEGREDAARVACERFSVGNTAKQFLSVLRAV